MKMRPGGVAGIFSAIVLLLAAAQVAGLTLRFGFGHPYVHGLVPLFDFDREHNIPSLYSAVSLLCCSGLLALLAAEGRQSQRHDARYWGGLSLLFLLVSVDEQFALHERLILPLQEGFQVSGFFHFAWVIPYGLLLLGLGLFYMRFFLRLPSGTRLRFVFAAVLYVGGALGMEMVGGDYYERIGGVPDLPYTVMVTVEELLEMSGVIVFIHALLTVMADRDLQIRIVPDQASDRRELRVAAGGESSPRRI